MATPPSPRRGASASPPRPRAKPFRFPPPKDGAPSWTRARYFAERQRKLDAQAPAASTRVLAGAVCYFTGVKSTSQRRLEALVWRNGGAVAKVWHRRRVTHVVADCLAASKVEKEVAAGARAAVVVSPRWIEACVRRGEKVPTWPFRVVQGPPDVRDVASFFRKGKRDGDRGGGTREGNRDAKT